MRRTGPRDGFATSAVLQVVGRLTAAALGLGTLAILTSRLGPEAFGRFTAALSLALLLGALTSAGLATTAARDAALHPERAPALHAAALTLRTLGVAVSVPIAVGIAVVAYGRGVSLAAVGLLTVAVGLGGLGSVSALGLVMTGRGWLAGVLDPLRQAILLLALIVLLDDLGVASVYVLGLGAGAAVTVLLALRALPWSSPRSELRALARQSRSLAVVEALNTIYFRIDGVLLVLLSGTLAAGDYGVAYRLTELVMSVPGIVMTSLVPRLARSEDPTVVVRQGLQLLHQLAIPLVLLGVVGAPGVIHALTEPGFDGAVHPLQLLVVATAVSFLVAPYGNGLVLLRRQDRLVRVALVVTAANIAANLAVVPWAGATGAAAAVLATEAVAFVMARRRFDEVARIRVPWARRPLAGGIAMLAVWAGSAALTRAPWPEGASGAVILLGMSLAYAVALAAPRRVRRSV
jgi:O-antigen/teichoic acid export membrane protein